MFSRQQPSCALSLQFLFDKFNGCLAVGHARTHGAVSCQEPDGSTLGLLISQTASLAALRQVKEREQGEGEMGRKQSREEGMGAGDDRSEEGGYEQLGKGLKGGRLNKEERKRVKFGRDSRADREMKQKEKR